MFVYNRPGTTRRTVEALKRNALSELTDVFVYSDGGRDEKSWREVGAVRRYLKSVAGFRSFTVIERPRNLYLEDNVIDGVSETLARFGSAIVLEDDVVTGRNFLKYMNRALGHYRDVPRVMHISGFCIADLRGFGQTVLWSYPEGSAWGTWADRWEKFRHFQSREEALSGLSEEQVGVLEMDGSFKCLGNLDARPIPWDLCWYIAIVKNHGLCLTPTVSLARNIGLYAGTHFSTHRVFGRSQFDVRASDLEITDMAVDIANDVEAIKRMKHFCATARFELNPIGKLYWLLRSFIARG